jgi:hypothetical protein
MLLCFSFFTDETTSGKLVFKIIEKFEFGIWDLFGILKLGFGFSSFPQFKKE